MKEIYRTTRWEEAETLRLKLEREGIPTRLFSHGGALFAAGHATTAVPYTIAVPPQRAQVARDLIDDHRELMNSVHDHKTAATENECLSAGDTAVNPVLFGLLTVLSVVVPLICGYLLLGALKFSILLPPVCLALILILLLDVRPDAQTK